MVTAFTILAMFPNRWNQILLNWSIQDHQEVTKWAVKIELHVQIKKSHGRLFFIVVPNQYYQWWLTSKIQLLNPQTFYISYIAGWHKLQLCIWEADYKKRGWPHIFSMPQHCFVAKQSNMTLFCRETLKYGTFCRET